MKIDLSDVTFVIPLRIESEDRFRNAILTTAFLLNHFNTNIIIKEVDVEPKFEKVVEILNKICPDQSGLSYFFEKETNNIFHRTKILNDMILMSKTKIIANYDIDVILPINSYTETCNLILNDTYDIVYPFVFGTHGERKVQFGNKFDDPVICNFIESGFDPNVFPYGYYVYYNDYGLAVGWAEYGCCQFIKRDVYLGGFLENEDFISWGPEDQERYYRFNLLGYRIGRLDSYVYHLEHQRTKDSCDQNSYFQPNHDLFDKLKKLSKEEFVSYYKNQKYVRERGINAS